MQDDKPAQPDPTKSVADEIERRQETGMPDTDTPKVNTEFGGPGSRSEAESDKPWSRAAGEVQERETKKHGTAPEDAGTTEG